MSITIKKNLVSTSKYSLKCPNKMDAEYISVHNTANDASAENEIKYMISNGNSTSFHIAVDNLQAIQGIPFDRNAWAAGDGNGPGNRKSIHIEICYSKSGGDRYSKAEANAITLIAQLLKERGWGIEKVKKHQDWNGKYCPHRILSEGRWNSFLRAIKKELDDNINTANEEGEIRMYNPSNQSMLNSTATVLKRLEEKENGISPDHRKKLLEGKLKLDDAIGLFYVAKERGLM